VYSLQVTERFGVRSTYRVSTGYKASFEPAITQIFVADQTFGNPVYLLFSLTNGLQPVI